MVNFTAQKERNITCQATLLYVALTTAVEACCGVDGHLTVVATLSVCEVSCWPGVEDNSLVVWHAAV